MIPKGSKSIDQIITAISEGPIARATDEYSVAELNYLREGLKMVSTDFDRAVDLLVSEHKALMEIFAAARESIDDNLILNRLSEAVEESPSLRVSDLLARADQNMQILIELHEAVEDALQDGADWADQINLKIWQLLDNNADQHKFRD